MHQVPLSVLSRPPQLPPAYPPKSITYDEMDALNTRNSTQQTARDDPRPPLLTLPVQPAVKSHISLIDSPKEQSPLRNSRAGIKAGSVSKLDGGQKFKSLRKVGSLGQSEKADSSRRSRRHKIFDSSYFPKPVVQAQQKRGLNHHASAHNLLAHSQHAIPHHFTMKQTVIPPFPAGKRDVRFLDSIPVVENSRLVRVNSCSRMGLEGRGSTGKIKFTYQQSNQPPLQQSSTKIPLPLNVPLQKPTFTYTTPVVKNTIYTSNVCPVYSPLPLQASQQNHSNPVRNKIKRPNPPPTHDTLHHLPSALRKGTIIDEIKCPPSAEVNIRSIGYEYFRGVQVIGSKVSLGNNIRESLVCGSLATERLRIGDSFSNIQDNSQRYFDDEDELPQGQRISYKNIDIPNENQDHTDPTELHVQNIFSDFQQSRRQERERQRQREKEREKDRVERAQRQRELMSAPDHILQQSTLALQQQKPNGVTLPIVLIGLAALLLLIQLLC